MALATLRGPIALPRAVMAPPRAVITREPPMSDAFNRADGPLGSLDTGQLWVARTTTPSSIVGNKAQKVGGQAQYDFTQAGSEAAVNFDVQATVGGVGYGGLFGRFQDPNNCYFAQTLLGGTNLFQIYLRLDGVFYALGTAGVVCNAGDVMRFVGQGQNLFAFLNGALAISTVNGNITAPGTCGLYAYSSGFTHDDFLSVAAQAALR